MDIRDVDPNRPVDVTPVGFWWGSTCVERTAHIDRPNGRYKILTLTTPRETAEIYISPSGKLRVFHSKSDESRERLKELK